LDEALKARALRLLARREHSRAELARKLAPHAESPEALAALLAELLAKKQLSDERFAEVRSRALARKYGAARIRQDLRSKGVAAEIIGGVSSGGELERARAILERKYRTPPETFEERAKRARFLQGRGFSLAVIHELLDVVEPKAYTA
jgi:regulatory protein